MTGPSHFLSTTKILKRKHVSFVVHAAVSQCASSPFLVRQPSQKGNVLRCAPREIAGQHLSENIESCALQDASLENV
jgi:hypothetical protein